VLAQTRRLGSRRRHSRRRRGNVLLVVLIALTGLAALGSLTVVSVQGGLSTVTSDRSHSIALFAAESGASVALDFLRERYYLDVSRGFSDVTSSFPDDWQVPAAISGNEVLPGQPGNVFSPEMQAWYQVTVINNKTDPNWATPGLADGDSRVFLRSVGFGPDGATATVEVEIQGFPPPGQVIVLSWREVQ
jgi:hypothetical protein